MKSLRDEVRQGRMRSVLGQIVLIEITLPGAVYVGALFLFSRYDKLLSDEGIGRENVLRGVRAPGACRFIVMISLRES